MLLYYNNQPMSETNGLGSSLRSGYVRNSPPEIRWPSPNFESESTNGLSSPTFKTLSMNDSVKNSWIATVRSFHSTQRENVKISPFPLLESSFGCFMIRTAIEMIPSKVFAISLAEIPLCYPFTKIIIESCHPLLSDGRELVESSCQCVIKRDSRIVCTFEPTPQSIFDYLSLRGKGGGRWNVPIERMPSNQGVESMHVCLQGVLFPDQTNGDIPSNLIQSFVEHYTRLGFTDIHLYINSSSGMEIGKPLTSFPVDLASRLWVHDTLFPILDVFRSRLTGQQQKFQGFVQADCYLRAISSGSKWTLLIDLDEFVYPTENHMEGSLLNHLNQVVSASVTNVWLSSYVFHTWYCSNDTTSRHIQDRFKVGLAKLDLLTYAGRRKGIYRAVDPLYAAINVFPFVHDVIIEDDGTVGDLRNRYLDSFHIHHFRESFHAHVCNKTIGVDPIPDGEGWRIHPDCSELLSNRRVNH
jgi:hypothetical protein